MPTLDPTIEDTFAINDRCCTVTSVTAERLTAAGSHPTFESVQRTLSCSGLRRVRYLEAPRCHASTGAASGPPDGRTGNAPRPLKDEFGRIFTTVVSSDRAELVRDVAIRPPLFLAG